VEVLASVVAAAVSDGRPASTSSPMRAVKIGSVFATSAMFTRKRSREFGSRVVSPTQHS
jgi:hypothetical protein